MRTQRLLVLYGLLLGGCVDLDSLASDYGKSDAAATNDLADAAMNLGDDGGADLAQETDLKPICDDNAIGAGETDVDCGGGCAPCDVGRACLVDGDCQTDRCQDGRCELASGPPSWLPVGTAATGSNPPIARNDLTLERASDGNLYAIGGQDSSGSALVDVEKLDGALSWSTPPAQLNNDRSTPASVYTGSEVFVLGGKDGSPEPSVEKMGSPPNWSVVSGLSYGIIGAGAAFGSDGRIYVVGGFDGGGTVKSVKAFAPGDNSFATAANLGTGRDHAGVAVGADSRIYAIGGHESTTLDSVEAYTVATDTWAPAASLPEPRMSTRAVLAPDGRIYLPGGVDIEGGRVYKSVVAYTSGTAPLGDRWTHVASLMGPRQRHGVAVGQDGRIYVVAGSDVVQLLRTVEAYGPVISSSPTHAHAGDTIAVAGSNFAKNATVRFSLDSAGGPAIGTGTSDASGVLAPTMVMIPADASSGATRLYVSDSKSRYPVSTKFTVDP